MTGACRTLLVKRRDLDLVIFQVLGLVACLLFEQVACRDYATLTLTSLLGQLAVLAAVVVAIDPCAALLEWRVARRAG